MGLQWNNPAYGTLSVMAIELSGKCEKALLRFMREYGIDDRDSAITHILQDWLACRGYVKTGSIKTKSGSGNGTDGIDPEFVQYPSYFKDDGSI